MSTPPDFLGMALGMLNQQRQRSADTQDQRQNALVMQMRVRANEEAEQQDTLKLAVELGSQGYDFNSIMGLVGDKLPESYRPFVKEVVKKQKEKQDTPRGAEMEDVAKGMAAIQQNNPDPLRGALDRLRAEESLPYTTDNKSRLGLRADFISQAQQARAGRETKRVTEQSDITEARQKRLIAERAANVRDKATKGTNAGVEAAYKMFRQSGLPFDEWAQSIKAQGLPAALITSATRHPLFENRQPPPLLARPTAQLGAPITNAPAPPAAEWTDIGGGIKVRKK